MNTTRWLLGAIVGGSLALVGCGGSGQYRIPDVAPVVKQKPQDDLLDALTDDTEEEKKTETPAPATTGGTTQSGTPQK